MKNYHRKKNLYRILYPYFTFSLVNCTVFISIKNKLKGMRKLLKSFKTEINPTVEQKIKINKTIGTCRYVYNFYLGHNKALYDKGEKFMMGKSFSVWLNNEYIPNNPDKIWMKEAYSKAVKKSIEDGCTAFTRYLDRKSVV